MSYTVLARKYRSRTFDEVIGQEPVATTLVNAIKSDRVHHGYLFTGTRGVGKTSMARILAKALNCLKSDGPTATPCCECDACVAIAEGQDIDVVEIDAASNTGVDNIRELRSNTAYRPARARFKVYIIDEVHMLSTGAFNALLKTLEEPPEHVKFILATTEIQKVPATIQSRCQRFNFRHIGPDVIAARLRDIAKAEGAKADDAVVQRVARLAAGSMRDALSILDQLLSVSPKKLTPQVLDEVLPPSQDESAVKLFDAAASGDVATVLATADQMLSSGRGLEVFCADLIAVARSLMLVRACGKDAPLVDVPTAGREAYDALSQRFELSQYVQMIAMLEELRRNVRYSGVGRALTDALLVRFARMHEWAPIEALLAGGTANTGGSAEKKKSPLPPPVAAPRAVANTTNGTPRATAEIPRKPAAAAPAPVSEPPADEWAGQDDQPPLPAEPPDVANYADIVMDQPVGTEPVGFDAPPVGRSLSPAAGREITSKDRAEIMRDPVVKSVLDLFDGQLVYMAPATPPATESDDSTDDETE